MSTNISLRVKKTALILLVATLIVMLSYMLKIQAENNNNVPIDTSHTQNSPSVEEELIILKEMKNEIRLEESQRVNVQETINMNQYSKVTVVATGYTAGIESTGKSPDHPQYGITFSGVRVQRDPASLSTIAADIKVFPLGTILFIPGYGYGIVADTGSAIKGNKIDLYYDSVEEVYQEWGKKKIEVYIIQKGNGKLTEELLKQYEQVAIANLVM